MSFHAQINIKDVCETCPVRQLIDCNTAKPTGTGEGLCSTSYVEEFTDSSERLVAVRVQEESIVMKLGARAVIILKDIPQIIDRANRSIDECEGPIKKGMLRRQHCATNIGFGVISKIAQEERKEFLERLGADGLAHNPPKGLLRPTFNTR